MIDLPALNNLLEKLRKRSPPQLIVRYPNEDTVDEFKIAAKGRAVRLHITNGGMAFTLSNWEIPE